MREADAIVAAERAIRELGADAERVSRELGLLESAGAALAGATEEVVSASRILASARDAANALGSDLRTTTSQIVRDFEERIRLLVQSADESSRTAERALLDSASSVRNAEQSFQQGAQLLQTFAEAYQTTWVRAADKALQGQSDRMTALADLLDAAGKRASESANRIQTHGREAARVLAETTSQSDAAVAQLKAAAVQLSDLASKLEGMHARVVGQLDRRVESLPDFARGIHGRISAMEELQKAMISQQKVFQGRTQRMLRVTIVVLCLGLLATVSAILFRDSAIRWFRHRVVAMSGR